MQIILLLETRSSCESDYRYIKSAIDYFYVERSFKLSKIYAKTKSELIKLDKKIRELTKKYNGKSVVLMCADYDREDDSLNDELVKYCENQSYDLVWMNLDVEEVFLGRQIPNKDKNKESLKFLMRKNVILPTLTNISAQGPLEKHPSSNLLVILDKYLVRKT